MFAACLLLAVAVFSGTLLTFLFDRTAPFAARLCMGACVGPALLAFAGFLAASWLGLGPASLAVSAALIILPALLLFQTEFRRRAAESFTAAMQAAFRKPGRMGVAYAAFYGAIAVVLAMVFSAAVYHNAGGVFTGITNNLGDLPLHLQVINSFVQGQNFPPQDPTFAGVRFAYPFLCDLLTAMLVRLGATTISAMWLQNMVLALALTGLVHYWTLLMTRSRLAGLIAPALVLFSGGLGWTWILMEVHNSDGGLVPLLSHLTHDYTIAQGASADFSSLFRWGNSLTTLFAPQRSILFGMPLAIVIFCQWWSAMNPSSEDSAQQAARARMIAAGAVAGLLPLIHAHTFLVVMGVGACLAVIFRARWRDWVSFFMIGGALALPQAIWLATGGTISTQQYLGWYLGWDHGQANIVWFWFVNTGFFIPALLVALLWRHPKFALPRQLLIFYLPFVLCFIVPNVIKLAPWVWDNIKVLFYWYLASVPLVALLLATGLKQKSAWRWLAAGALASMVLSGGLDVLRVVSGASEYREFDPQGMAIADAIAQHAGPRAVVLHAPSYNTPVFLTGRRSLLGYPGWMFSRGLDYSQRNTDIASIYAGAPQAESLMKQYHVEYVLIGPEELATMKVNEPFWSKFSNVAQAGGYRLFKTNVQEERAVR